NAYWCIVQRIRVDWIQLWQNKDRKQEQDVCCGYDCQWEGILPQVPLPWHEGFAPDRLPCDDWNQIRHVGRYCCSGCDSREGDCRANDRGGNSTGHDKHQESGVDWHLSLGELFEEKAERKDPVA